MIYKATTQRSILVFLLLLSMGGLFQYRDNLQLYYVMIPEAILLLILVFMRFVFKINEDSLTFKIHIFNLPIYQKEVHYSQIQKITFTRSGWGKKCVIVKNKKGFNFRITNFYPDRIYGDLSDFASKNKITVLKTKDYVILDRVS